MNAKKNEKKNDSETYYAVVRVRGTANIRSELAGTFKMLNLTKPNHCSIVRKSPSSDGMLRIVKDYITWGEINSELKTKLEAKSGGKNPVRLHPPRKGHGRKGTGLSFRQGGALGYRGEKIGELIERML